MKAKFIYPPRLYGVTGTGYPRYHHHLVPLGLPTLVSYLRRQGFRADQDDLDIKCFSLMTKGSRKAPKLKCFLQRERIIPALDGSDDELLREAERCLRMTRTRGYDAIGFSLTDEFNLGEVGSALLMARLLKEEHEPFIVFGGSCVNSTMNLDLIAASPHVDANFSGEHFLVHNLLSVLEADSFSQGSSDLVNPGVRDGAVVRHRAQHRKRLPFMARRPPSPLTDVDPRTHTAEELLPLPVFDGLPLDLYRFSAKDITCRKKLLILPYQYLFGCQGNCAFCYQSGVNAFGLKEPAVIAGELEYLSKKHKTNCFYFRNANCNPSLPFVEGLTDELLARDLNLRWTDCANLIALGRGTLSKLREAGAVRLIFGLECASDRMLRYVGKPVMLARAEKLLGISHDLGIWNELEIIAGMPHEREEDVHSTEMFLRKNSHAIDYFYLNLFYLPRPSRMLSSPRKYGLENIRKDSRGRGYAFDETGRLSWKQSLEQGKRFFGHLLSLREELYPFGYTGMEDSFLKLFYLSVLLDDKSEVKERLRHSPSIFTTERAARGIHETGASEHLPDIYYRLPDARDETGVNRAP